MVNYFFSCSTVKRDFIPIFGGLVILDLIPWRVVSGILKVLVTSLSAFPFLTADVACTALLQSNKPLLSFSSYVAPPEYKILTCNTTDRARGKYLYMFFQ